MKRISYINVLRLICTLSVVLLHTSAGLLDNDMVQEHNLFVFSLYRNLGQFAVPVFVMISGCLFLSPDKKLSYSILLRKYVKRIAFALLVFGLPMCLIETYYSKTGGVIDAFCNFLTGYSWAHMWYLYMIICLYMLTPLLKAFVSGSSKKTIEIALIVLFFLSSVLPTMQFYGISIKSWMTLPPYIFYYLLGYYLAVMEDWKIGIGTVFSIVMSYILFICIKAYLGVVDPKYFDVSIVIGSIGIFLLAKRLNLKWGIADKLSPYCFAIYLIHPFFINAVYKGLKIDPMLFVNPWIGIPFVCVLFILFSLISGCLLYKIPVMKRYVL